MGGGGGAQRGGNTAQPDENSIFVSLCPSCVQASELYEVLMGQEKERGGDKEESERGWLAVWVDPVIAQLCSSDKKLKQHIIEVR